MPTRSVAVNKMELQHPFTCMIAGPSGCGKTSLTKAIIQHQLIEPKPNKILWLYAEDQPMYKSMKGVEFIQGIPDDLETRFDAHYNNLLIIDDLMTRCQNDDRLTRLFSVGSHHRNLSIIFIVHNLFSQGKEMRTLSLNTHYIVLFKNPRDRLQISVLARQMYAHNARFLIEAYHDATQEAYGYLMMDLKPTTKDILRVRTGILPGDRQLVYVQHNEADSVSM